MNETNTEAIPPDWLIDSTPATIEDILQERGKRYGGFNSHATITQGIKRVMQNAPNWASLSDDKKEALDMIAHKIGRILNGDSNYHDSWFDLIGYAKLIADGLEA